MPNGIQVKTTSEYVTGWRRRVMRCMKLLSPVRRSYSPQATSRSPKTQSPCQMLPFSAASQAASLYAGETLLEHPLTHQRRNRLGDQLRVFVV